MIVVSWELVSFLGEKEMGGVRIFLSLAMCVLGGGGGEWNGVLGLKGRKVILVSWDLPL